MAHVTDVILPTDQTEGTSNVVGKWFKAVGDPVALNEPLLEITTDKVTVEIPAPAAGVLTEILKVEGTEVEQGDILGRSTDGAVVPGAPAPSAPAAHLPAAASIDATELSPAVRRLLKEHGPPALLARKNGLEERRGKAGMVGTSRASPSSWAHSRGRWGEPSDRG